MKCYHPECAKVATSYCIVEDGYDACDDHATGDYHWPYEDMPNA